MQEVRRIWLTASGGPFLHTPKTKFAEITIEQALNHPTWKMGNRITIDSATLMNKGFEVIEACRLFDIPPEQVSVIVHPQSTIHSLVEFVDGSILAQLSVTDMRLPILYALTYPERIPSELNLRLGDLRHLDFSPPDMEKFPCLRLAYEAVRAGGSKTVALNAADEVAVSAFLEGSIGFMEIPAIIEQIVTETPAGKLESIGEVLAADHKAREAARDQIGSWTRDPKTPAGAGLREN
jgi:1-deoxy-D-xylulose-5-phosphate reductoisomerase